MLKVLPVYRIGSTPTAHGTASAARRLTAVLPGEDDSALEQRVCGKERSVKVYADATDWLARESAYLRKVARLLDTAGGRVSAVLGRCRGSAAAP